MKKLLCFFLAAALLLCVGCSQQIKMPYDFPAPEGKDLAARAEGIPVYAEEIENAYEAQLQANDLNRQYFLSSGEFSEEEKQSLIAQLTPPSRQEILQKKILRILQLKEAEKHGIPDYREEAEAQARTVTEAFARAEDSPQTAFARDVYRAAVERSGLTEKQYEQRVTVPAYQQDMILQGLKESFETTSDKNDFYGAATYEEYIGLLTEQYEVEIFITYQD